MDKIEKWKNWTNSKSREIDKIEQIENWKTKKSKVENWTKMTKTENWTKVEKSRKNCYFWRIIYLQFWCWRFRKAILELVFCFVKIWKSNWWVAPSLFELFEILGKPFFKQFSSSWFRRDFSWIFHNFCKHKTFALLSRWLTHFDAKKLRKMPILNFTWIFRSILITFFMMPWKIWSKMKISWKFIFKKKIFEKTKQ